MVVIRPIELGDLDQLLALTAQASYGLTTLPHDREVLAKRIEESVRGFATEAQRPQGEVYLFVMEDLATGRVVGTTGVVSKVGGYEPFYAYRVETTVHESKLLEIRKEIGALHLVREHDGPCEIGSLFLGPEYRGGGNGRLLSLSRFLFMATHPQAFAPTVIAEMRGVLDDRGHSAFWEALGRHFFDIEYPKADYLCMVDKGFIADLMPTHPIYIPLLPKEAQGVIAQVHENTRPARAMLESAGFRYNGLVDIFEAGPILSCPLEKIRTVHQSRVSQIVGVAREPIESPRYLVSNNNWEFRACQGALRIDGDGGGVHIGQQEADALGVGVGQSVRYALAKPIVDD